METLSGFCGLSRDDLKSLAKAETTAEEQVVIDAVQAVDGLICLPEMLALHRLCRQLPEGSKILEIGSFTGASAVAMGHAIHGREITLYCCDPWTDYTTQEDFAVIEHARIADNIKILKQFASNTAFLGTQLKMLRGFYADFADMLSGSNFDLIFIDGAHDYASVRADILMSLSILKPGGLLTGHDFHSCGHGVRKAVNELIAMSPTIFSKNVIDHTSIWFAQIMEPLYEKALTTIVDLHSCGDVSGALQAAYTALKQFKTEELLNIIAALKNEAAFHRKSQEGTEG